MGIGGWPGPYNDYRTTWHWFSVIPSNTAPTEDEQYDYFFVPAVGYYSNDKYYSNMIQYYTSTMHSEMGIYMLFEGFGGLAVYYTAMGTGGMPAVPFF